MSSKNESLFTARSLTDSLNLVTEQFVNQLPLILTILGSIGFLGNAFIFLQPTLRRNTFAIFSLCGSLVDILNLFINLFPTYLNSVDGNLASAVSTSILCKLKLFAVVFLPQLSMDLLILSMIDRFACTCALDSPIRRLRQLKMVPWLLGITVVVTCFISLYSPILYDIVPGLGCISTHPLLNSILYIAIQGIMTPMVMIVFVLLAYRNIKQSRQRVGLIETGNQRRPATQFIGMVFMRIFVSTFFVLQWMAVYLYYSITSTDAYSADRLEITYFVLSLTSNLYYVINVKSFYLSTLTSRSFRAVLKTASLKFIYRCPCLRRFAERANLPTSVVTNRLPGNPSRRPIGI